MKVVRALFAVLAIAAVASCRSAPDEESSGADCSSRMWPRVIVGGAGGAENRVSVQVRLADGTIMEGHRQGCPEVRDVICSYSFFTAPRDKEVVLLVQSEGGAAERRITMGPFTHEGRNITYVVVTVPENRAPEIGEPRLIHPC